MRRSFKDFRLKELNGGLNLENNPNEIEDKQGIKCENFNFDGNKLVTGPGISREYQGFSTTMTRGITVDGNDIWHMQDGNIFKNGVLEHYNNYYNVLFDDPSGEILSFSIDGNNKIFQTTSYADLSTQFTSWVASLIDYNIVDKGTGSFDIYKDDGTSISLSNPDLVRQIQLNNWDEHSEIDIIIDGVTYNIPTGTSSTGDGAITYLEGLLPTATYYWKREAANLNYLTIARKDSTAISISSTTYNRYTYELENKNSTLDDTPDRSVFNPSLSGSSTYRSSATTFDGTIYTLNTGFTQYVSSGTQTYTNTSTLSSIIANYTIYNDKHYQLGLFDIIAKYIEDTTATYTSLSDVYANPISGVDIHFYSKDFRKNDYSQITLSNIENTAFYDGTIYGTYAFPDNRLLLHETNHLATITVVTYNEITRTITNKGIQITIDDLYNITVSNIGILLVSAIRGIDAVFIDSDGVATTIPTSVIGSPTVGTIYNGKIVLGGYSDNDNIIFSKTSTPSTQDDILDFSGYSAGGQSISGGNKGIITGFKVGENGLYVFKDNEVWYTNSEKDTGTNFNFVFNKITSNGAANQNSIVEVEQETFYFDYKNRAVRRLGYEQNLTTLRDVAISKEVETILKSIPNNDEGNDERYSGLINLSYKYPYLEVNYADNTSPYIYISGIDENFKYRIPDKTLVYNVDNKSWATRTDKGYVGKYSILSDKGYYGTDNGDVYNSISGYSSEISTRISKEFDLGDGVDYKKYGEVEILGNSEETGTLTVEIYVDDTLVETRDITTTGAGLISYRNRIDIYNTGQLIKVKLIGDGLGKIEISNLHFRWKPDFSYNNYY